MSNRRPQVSFLLKTTIMGGSAGSALGCLYGLLYGPVVVLLLWWSGDDSWHSLIFLLNVMVVVGALIGFVIGALLGSLLGSINGLAILLASRGKARVIAPIVSFGGAFLASFWCEICTSLGEVGGS